MAGTWLYGRNGDSIEVRRWDCDVGGRLVVIEGSRRTEEAFDDAAGVVDAQRRLETVLRAAGWVLQDFYPDRRTGFDRRIGPRESERRRSSRPGRR